LKNEPIGHLLRFIQLETFVRAWKHLGLDDGDAQQLESLMIADPKRGVVVPGTGGMRKLRFAPASWGMGKSGGLRTIYYFVERHGTVCLVTAYDHRAKSDVTPAEKAEMKGLVEEIEGWFKELRK
jgi:hypothetical protein